MKESKGAKIRNRYNQVPHLTQDTNIVCKIGFQSVQVVSEQTAIIENGWIFFGYSALQIASVQA